MPWQGVLQGPQAPSRLGSLRSLGPRGSTVPPKGSTGGHEDLTGTNGVTTVMAQGQRLLRASPLQRLFLLPLSTRGVPSLRLSHRPCEDMFRQRWARVLTLRVQSLGSSEPLGPYPNWDHRAHV